MDLWGNVLVKRSLNGEVEKGWRRGSGGIAKGVKSWGWDWQGEAKYLKMWASFGPKGYWSWTQSPTRTFSRDVSSVIYPMVDYRLRIPKGWGELTQTCAQVQGAPCLPPLCYQQYHIDLCDFVKRTIHMWLWWWVSNSEMVWSVVELEESKSICFDDARICYHQFGGDYQCVDDIAGWVNSHPWRCWLSIVGGMCCESMEDGGDCLKDVGVLNGVEGWGWRWVGQFVWIFCRKISNNWLMMVFWIYSKV